MAASPLPSRGPKRGWNCYAYRALSGATPLTFTGVPHAKHGVKIGLATHPYLLRAPKEGGVATHTVRCSGSPTKRTKLEAATRTLPSPGPRTTNPERKSELATSPLPSRGPKRGRNCYATLAFLGGGGPQRQARGQNQKWLPQRCLLGGQKLDGIDTQLVALHSRASSTKGTQSELATSPLPSRGPKRGRNCYATLAFSGVPNPRRGDEIRRGSLTPAFSGARKRVEATRPPHSRGSATKGTKSEVATSPLPSRGPKRGWNGYATPTFLGGPNAKRGDKIRSGCLTPAFPGAQKRVELLATQAFSGGWQRQARGQNHKWLPHPCLLGGPKEVGFATHPAFSGSPNAKHVDKIRSGSLTLAFFGDPIEGESATPPLHSRGSPTKGTKSEVATSPPHPCLLGGQKEGGIATQPLHSQGSPTSSAGTKSQVGTSPLPSPGPKGGWNGYATPTVSGVRNKGHEIRSGYLTPAISGAQKRAALRHNPCILGGRDRINARQQGR